MDRKTYMLEQQRYNNIKATGKWLELDILIGGEPVDEGDGVSCIIPVTRMEGHNCGSKEIASLYLTVKSMLEEIKHEYPEECIAAELSAKVEKNKL